MFDPLVETALRVFTLRDPAPPNDEEEDDDEVGDDIDANDWGSGRPQRAYPREALVWDTETLTSPEQRLLVLTYRLYSTDPGETQPRCIDEGVIHPDELPNRDPAGYRTLRSWAHTHEWAAAPGLSRPDGGRTIRCEPLSWWLDQRLRLYGYGHRDHCDVVGFNLLFDLGRVAQHWEAAKGDFYGGWWLGFIGETTADGGWENRYWAPRLRVKALDPRRARYRWSAQTDQGNAWRGSQARIVDLRTLSYALTDADHSLESACREFGVCLPSTGESFTKAEVEHGVITPDLLDYARLDVEATAELYFACLRELEHHPGVDLDAPWLYSPASIGAKYLDAIGIRRPLEKFTQIDPVALGWQRPRRGKRRRPPPKDTPPRGDLDPRVLGWAMTAFYGGRAEARIVRTPVPVTLVDFRSMYPAVNALLDTRSILTADRVGIEAATDHVRSLLDAPDLVEACYRPDTWRDQIGVTLVEVEPGGATLPVRAHYDPDSDDYGIGVNPYTLDATTWYALPDLIAARLLGNSNGLKVHQAIRLRGEDTQSGLTTVRLRGDAQLDPRRRDPFLTMVEERHRVLQNPSVGVREREWRERFLKVTANATSYGVLARFDRREHARPVPVTVYGPDHDPLNARVTAPEDPGPYCFPPIAASITAAARLMLTLLEHAIIHAGGSYAFCDTDALAITRAGSTNPSADEDTIRRALDRFEPLNPYDAEVLPGSPWQVKHDSLTHPVHCYAISAKRYALYQVDRAGQPQLVDVADDADTDPADDDTTLGREGELVDWSEHGLGLYLDPTTTDHDQPPRDTEGRRVWVRQAWDWILKDAHGSTPPLPEWAGRYAVTRYTVTGPRTEAWFAGYNKAHPSPEERIRPGCFGLLAHPQPAVLTDVHPTAEYEPRPTHWPLVPWYDRATGTPAHLFTLEGVDPDELAALLAHGAIPIQTLKDFLTRYRLRAEHKSLTRHGATAQRDTLGPLQRRPVESRRILQDLIGKEANNLLERLSGELTDPAEYRTDYTTRHGDRWQLTVETLRTLNISDIAHTTNINRRTIQRAMRRQSPTRPHQSTQAKLTAATAPIAAEILAAAGEPCPAGSVPALIRYIEWTRT